MEPLEQQFPPSLLAMVKDVVPSLKALALRALVPSEAAELLTAPPEVLRDWSHYVGLTRHPDHYRTLILACLQRGGASPSCLLQALAHCRASKRQRCRFRGLREVMLLLGGAALLKGGLRSSDSAWLDANTAHPCRNSLPPRARTWSASRCSP
jgi:hypothetical protein